MVCALELNIYCLLIFGNFVYYRDIEDKYTRKRDRMSYGAVTDFKEKEGYKPEVKITYVDDKGRQMDAKEAFRYLSHRFHGKGSGKKKTEKRIQKYQEELVTFLTLVPVNAYRCLLFKFRTVHNHLTIQTNTKTSDCFRSVFVCLTVIGFHYQMMRSMSSSDTPLGTASLLEDKLKKEKLPYLVLSGASKSGGRLVHCI